MSIFRKNVEKKVGVIEQVATDILQESGIQN